MKNHKKLGMALLMSDAHDFRTKFSLGLKNITSYVKGMNSLRRLKPTKLLCTFNKVSKHKTQSNRTTRKNMQTYTYTIGEFNITCI